MATRLSLSFGVGLVVTLALFYLMQALIQGAGSALTENTIGNLVDFVRLKEDPELTLKDRNPDPPPVEEPPPPPKPEFIVEIDQQEIALTDPTAGLEMGGGPGFGFSEGDYLPIVKVEPVYPRRALTRGMSGWVILEFTVTELGTVIDPVVLSNCGWIQRTGNVGGDCVDSPSTVFDSAARKAALKFKYKPKVIDGEAVATAGVKNQITFNLNSK